MSDIPVYRTDDVPATATAEAIRPRAAHGISVEIADAAQLSDVQTHWDDLLARADAPNVFMHPVVLRAAAEAEPGTLHRALLAWKTAGGRRQLLGLWAFAVGRARKSGLPIRVLSAPSHIHGHLATPVIDRDCLDETLDAMLDCIADAPRLPKIVAIDPMGTGGPTYDALLHVLARRGSAPRIFEQSRRPKLVSGLDGKTYLEKALSSSTRKKLRQHRRKLSEKGAVTSVVAKEPEAVRGALDDFLTMEASGWKGRQGTALLNSQTDAAFMRGAVGALADAGCASVHSLCVDGKPISMQIVAQAGRVAFTWKTTYDEAYQDFSPGMLLLEDYTTAFLADESIAFVDSCSFDDSGFMSAWTERQPVADLWIDARRGSSVAFRTLGAAQQSYRRARAAAKAAYLSWRKSNRRKS